MIMLITEATTIRELIAYCPRTRAVFDRYGLEGCGGSEGPVVSIGYFSRAPYVDLNTLLKELNDVIVDPAAPTALPASPADAIYKLFFKAAIFATLTAGALWGAYILLTIAVKGSFTEVSIFDVNAHEIG